MEVLRIPERRVPALIGVEGKTKKKVEKLCNVKLNISGEGEVEIEGESADVFFATDVIKAIGRGFEPKDALMLVKEDYQFFLIDLKEHTGNDRAVKRIKGRIIGEKGKVKKEIEQATESKISVYGNTVGIISKIDTIEYAKEAVSMLIQGARHSRVYGYLGGVRRKIMGERLRG